jgi:hypothetical protein
MMLRNQERLYCQLSAPPRVGIVHHRGNRLVLFAVLAVVCVFLFHLPAGPWSAVNGPATALQAARFALTIFLLIALASSAGRHRIIPVSVLAFERVELQEQQAVAPPTLAATPIRC